MNNLIENTSKISIRMLNADEFDREDLVKIFVDNQSLVPNPLVTNIHVAENEEKKIIAIGVLQPQYHAEPVWVHPEYRNIPSLHAQIIESMFEPLKNIKGLRIWIFSPDSRIAKLAMRFGFIFKNYEVFVKEF